VAAFSAVTGTLLASAHFGNWPSSGAVITALRPVLASADGPVLMPDAGNVPEYYLPSETARNPLYLWYFGYRSPETGKYLTAGPAYADAIRNRYFSVIVLFFSKTDGITADIARYGGYRVVARPAYEESGRQARAVIWVRDDAARGAA
jgi:hypothetical protein